MSLYNCKSERFTPAILEMTRNKVSISEICKLLSLSKVTVEKVLELNKFELLSQKTSNNKSKRLTPDILKLINDNVSISEISNKLKISNPTIKKVALENGIDIDKNLKEIKIKRNEQIYKMLLEGKTQKEIANEFKLSTHKIYEVAKFYKFNKFKESKKKHQTIIKNIKKDIKLNLPYEELIKKYNLDNDSFFQKLQYWGLSGALYREYKNNRNKNIGVEYKSGKKAIEITKSKKQKINQPKGIKTLSSVYSICSQQGIYKYPKIGRRIDGGSFEDVSVLRLVKKLREKEKYSFRQIADYMNFKKHRTICGKKFNTANARFKYYDALREGL